MSRFLSVLPSFPETIDGARSRARADGLRTRDLGSAVTVTTAGSAAEVEDDAAAVLWSQIDHATRTTPGQWEYGPYLYEQGTEPLGRFRHLGWIGIRSVA